MTHNFCRIFAKAVSRSRLCPHRTRDFVPATSNSALERRHSPRMPSQTLFDSVCSGKLLYPMVRHYTRSALPRKDSHRKSLALLASRDQSAQNSEMRCRNKPLFSDGLNTKPINVRFWKADILDSGTFLPLA